MAGVSKGVSLTHAFKFHKNKKKEKGQRTVSESVFRQVCYSFNKKVVDRVLEGFHTQLPHHMGFIRVLDRDWET